MTQKLSPEVDSRPTIPAGPVKCAVLTVSDARSPETDYGGRTVAYLLTRNGHLVVRRWIVPGETAKIDEAIADIVADKEVDALIMTGGTTLGRRDVTIETVRRRLEKRLDGFGELLRYHLYKDLGSQALLVRAIAGAIRGKIVIALPDSPGACELAMEKLVVPELENMVRKARR